MARTPEFEDMRAEEWPAELRALHQATLNAYYTVAELDAIHTANMATINDRLTMYELIGRAGALLRDLRAEGLRQLAAWEESQKADKAEDDNAYDRAQRDICRGCGAILSIQGHYPNCENNEMEREEMEGVDSKHN